MVALYAYNDDYVITDYVLLDKKIKKYYYYYWNKK
jgi:hypothetical protein